MKSWIKDEGNGGVETEEDSDMIDKAIEEMKGNSAD